MHKRNDTDWPRFVRTPEAARLLGFSPRTLEKHRCDGTGPVYHKLGGRVVYTMADLHAWVDACARQSTSGPLTPDLAASQDAGPRADAR